MKKLIGSNVLIKNAGKRKSFKISDIPAKISGYKVNDTNNNTVGIAGEVLNYSGNYLLQILNNKKEILLPLNDESISEIQEDKKIIVVKIPDGLLELYK
jgi:16S rRNA processing protein RimM